MINSPADKILDCATLITAQAESKTFSATGFFFDFEIDGQRVPVLVSNRHVFESFDNLQIRVRASNTDNPEERFTSYMRYTINMSRPVTKVILHPQSDIDLAIIPLAPIHHQLAKEGKHLSNYSISERILISESELRSLSAVENLIMPGCPLGIYDEANNLPILRRGITASHPAHAFKGNHVFLSDIACFPGSSGSPIFLYDPFGYPDYQNHEYNLCTSRIRLLGVQCRGYSHPETNQFINLAVAQQAHFLLDFKPILAPML